MDKFTVAHTHTQTHTHPFCLEFFPVCLTAPLSAFLYLSAMLCLSQTIFLFLISSSFFSLPILSFFPFPPPFPQNNSFLSACCCCLSFLAALISPSTVVFMLSLPGLSSVVISHTLLLSVSLPSELSAKMSLHLFMSLCTTPHCVSSTR